VNQDILEKCARAMEAEDLDGLIAMSPENFAYVAGFVVPSQPVLRWRHAAVVMTRDGSSSLYAVDMEASTVRALEPETQVRVWEEFAEDAMPVLAGLLRDMGLEAARVGIETDYLPARDMEQLTELLPKVAWRPAHTVFNRLRLIKTPRELELMRRLARITDRAIKEALESVRPGDTEMDLAAAATTRLLSLGADSCKWLILGSGERSQFPNVGPTMRELTRGDVVRLEIFGTLDGYNTGICRTAVVQEAAPEVREYWANIVVCRDLIFDSVRDGASGAEVYRKVADQFRSLGWESLSFVGHGIGLFVHEEPYIGSYGDARIEAGMVLGVEPVVLVPGAYGFQVKDIVAVGEGGHDLLSDVTNTDGLLVIE
jgi:Xaa-Pro aminopeptidase